MPTIVLRDYIYDDLGAPVGGIRARAFAKIGVGSRELVHVEEDFSQSDTGMWELTLDTDSSPTGLFTIEMYNPSTEQIRWRDGHVRIQVESMIGAHGEAPVADQSITANKIQDGAVTNAKMSDNTINSTKLLVTERTADQGIAGDAFNSGTLRQMLSYLVREILRMKGGLDWKTTPATTLSAAAAHMLDTNIHGPAVTVAAPLTSGYVQGTSVPKIAAGSINVVTSGNVGSFFINTPTPANGIITILLTDGSTSTTPQPLGVLSHEATFPDPTVLISFRAYPTLVNGTVVRVNFLMIYW